MQGTPLSGVERAMTQVPTSGPRRSEHTGLCRLRYSGRDPVCRNCLKSRSGSGGYAICLYTHERLKDDALTYGELVERCFQGMEHTHLQNRIMDITHKFPTFSFANSGHIRRMAGYLSRAGDPAGTKMNPCSLAALYLLTARDSLWRQAKFMLERSAAGRASVRGLDVQEYALYQMAKMLRQRRIVVSPGELADKKLVNDATLRLIINAILVAMYGQKIMGSLLRREAT